MPNFPLIRFDSVSKRFQSVLALAEVSFDIRQGELLALCGENGAGKSTLMKILSGVITDYEGDLRIDDVVCRLAGTREAEERGISIIHQELNLVGELSVAANIFLGRELCRAGFWLDQKSMLQQSAELLQQLECDIAPDRLVRELRVGDQQLVEIAKALSLQARVLIMDEPTSALTENEVARLFRVIARLRAGGTTIVYISHKMDEVFHLADRITVLRDGRVVQTLDRSATSPDEITRLMVGRDIAVPATKAVDKPGEELLRVAHLSLPWPGHARQWRLRDISFSVHRGEVVGFAGLMGAGRTELLECLYGSSPQEPEGEIRLAGRRLACRHPSEALAAGIAMVTEDRKREGVIPPFNVREHITLSSLWSAATAGIVHSRQEQARVTAALAQFRIRTDGSEAALLGLSGGNQQKCLIAKALETRPVLLLLDDPTRGIDVGAKAEIYRIIGELCASGLTVIITSSELPELFTVCDRILVLSEGRLTGEFSRENFSEEQIMSAATGNLQPV